MSKTKTDLNRKKNAQNSKFRVRESLITNKCSVNK